jgi:glycosyltransferase involved in cell wall biosynthesis
MVLRAAACLPTKDLETYFHVAAASPGYRFVLALARIANHPELGDHFERLNASLGHPVDLRWDVGYGDMTDLAARAGINLHTFGFVQPFGMPVSIIESMACGAVPILRDSAAGRAFAGGDALYYDDVSGAVTALERLAEMSDNDFNERSVRCAEYAYSAYADEVVLPVILDDWTSIVAGARSATAAAR